jgi:hypothetical protein
MTDWRVAAEEGDVEPLGSAHGEDDTWIFETWQRGQ